jgi:4-hydroxythreonine-4-phosphate dehydrogenase
LTAPWRTVALAIGDPNGIGPEIAVKAAAALAGSALHVVLVGDAFVVRHYADREAKGFVVREGEATAEDLPAPQTIDVMAVEALPRADSVGHGSAFDIAGRGMADPAAVLGALRVVGGATWVTA